MTLVGGGGKTTAMYALVRECAAEGGRAIATGTTLFTLPPAHQRIPLVMFDESGGFRAALAAALERERCAIVAAGRGNKGRLLPLPPEHPARLQSAFGLDRVIVEGDGSRGRPFKAPADHEPVIAQSSTLVVAVAGMSALGQPLDEAYVHRPEIVSALTGHPAGAPITSDVLGRVLADPRGGRKHVPASCRFAVLLNQVGAGQLASARDVAQMLLEAGAERVVLSRLEGEPIIVDIAC
jgi:molybdenum cofactor cytidylyltransferase